MTNDKTASTGAEKNAGRIISDEERDGVEPTDTEATTSLGVGESISRRGEDVAQDDGGDDRNHHGSKDDSGRPYGTSRPTDSTGVDPQESGGDSPDFVSS